MCVCIDLSLYVHVSFIPSTLISAYRGSRGGGFVGQGRRGWWSLMWGHIDAIGSLSTAVESTMNTYLQRVESRRFRVA